MLKLSNTSSDLLDKLVKAAENAKPKESANPFLDQIIPILETKPRTLEEVLREVRAQAMPAADPADPAAVAAPDPGVAGDLGGEADALAPEGDLGADIPPETEPEDPASLLTQAIELLQKAQTAMGGGAEAELGDDLDVDEEIPTDTAVSDMVGGEDTTALPETQPEPMLMAHRVVPNGKKRATK